PPKVAERIMKYTSATESGVNNWSRRNGSPIPYFPISGRTYRELTSTTTRMSKRRVPRAYFIDCKYDLRRKQIIEEPHEIKDALETPSARALSPLLLFVQPSKQKARL